MSKFNNVRFHVGSLMQKGLVSTLVGDVNAGVSYAVPVTQPMYSAIGMPEPELIFNMASGTWALPELVDGTYDILEQGGNSVGITLAQPTDLPNGELALHRTTLNTSRGYVSTNSVGDVGTTERIAFGAMVKYTGYSGGNNIMIGKRSSRGFDCLVGPTGRPVIFGRPASGGDASAACGTAHAVDTWHYFIWVMDRDPGVQEIRCLSEREVSPNLDISGRGSFDSTLKIPFNTSNRHDTEFAAMCMWSGADVALLTSAMCADFLEASGVNA